MKLETGDKVKPTIPFRPLAKTTTKTTNFSSGPKISPLASVDPGAKIGRDVEIGPFSVIGPNVTIGDRTKVHNNVTIEGWTTIGEDNEFFPNSVIGGPPQDVSYQGTNTQVFIGDRNQFREMVTVNRGSEKEEDRATRIGSDCFLLTGCHIGHDCILGDHITMANYCQIGGHSTIGDHVNMGGMVGVHHFVSVGKFSFVGAKSLVVQDSAPFMLVEGNPSSPRKPNIVALRRNNFSNEEIRAIQEAHRLIFRERIGLDSTRDRLHDSGRWCKPLEEMFHFLEFKLSGSKGRGRDQRRKVA